MKGEYNMRVSFPRATIKHCDIPLGSGTVYMPFTVDTKIMSWDDRWFVGDVHFGAVVGVGADEERAVLDVKREVGDVNVTGRTEDTTRLPV